MIFFLFIYLFIYLGQDDWTAARKEWIQTCSLDSPVARELYTHDVDSIATSISCYSSFATPVPLDLMAEVLENIWIESPLL